MDTMDSQSLTTCVVCSDAALATVRQLSSRSFHRDLDTRNSTEVASVCRKDSSPYSFHLE